MKKNFDVIIIGGGPGGLAVGTMLAKEGLSSVIIEKDPVLGGRYRSVDFHETRIDCAVHIPTSLSGSVETTYTHKLFSQLGLPLDYKIVPWPMGKVSKEKPGEIDFFTMDPKLGAANFFAFFAFATGVEMDDSTKKELQRVADICEAMSDEDLHKAVSMRASDWIEENVKDPMAKAVFMNIGPIIGTDVKDVNFAQVANGFGTFNRVGAPLLWYPKNGNLQTAIIDPLAEYYTAHGGEVITGKAVKNILIEDGKTTGVLVVDDQNNSMLDEYSAPVVICTMPIFEAVSRNIIERKFLTKDWAESVAQCAKLAVHDLTGFYLLRKNVINSAHGWVHIFDTDYGAPTYVGDMCLGTFTNSIVPPGKQLVSSLILGSFDATYFGIPVQMEKVKEAHKRWKDAMEKAFPGFNDAIEYEGMNLQLNFTRYAYAVVSTEIDIQPPNIEGLYFGGDSIRSVGTPMSDKCFQLAFPLCERVTKYVRKL
jgi:phytoene dehydrogenase-like protein